jgi:redox-sensitive bicupin YhaK (pirin superfamily)
VHYAPGEFPGACTALLRYRCRRRLRLTRLAAGAPMHPHRGFDTVMYLKQGEGRHSDSMGNSGILRAGGALLCRSARSRG